MDMPGVLRCVLGTGFRRYDEHRGVGKPMPNAPLLSLPPRPSAPRYEAQLSPFTLSEALRSPNDIVRSPNDIVRSPSRASGRTEGGSHSDGCPRPES